MKINIKEIKSYIIIIICVVLFRTFIATPVIVDGKSMEDTLFNNDVLILNKVDKKYKRFDIVVINSNGIKLVKRIIGLPGDNIKYKNNTLYINDKSINDVATERTANFTLNELYNIDKIPDGYYFVMGDNRNNSLDSRDSSIGLIKKSDIQGKTKIRIFPINKIGSVK